MHLIRWQTRCNWAIVSQLWLSYYCNVCGPSITKCPGHITETKQWVLCPWVDHYTIGFRPLYMMWWSIIQNAMMTYLPRRRAGIWKVFTEVVSLYSDLGLVKVLEKGEQSLQKHARDQRMVSMKPMRYLNGEVCVDMVQIPGMEKETRGRLQKRLQGMQDASLCLLDAVPPR